ncbi:MAG TPA: nucleotidyltransferase domain-containing protein [Myxococcota bacterium]|nr:nucleotidyltransferase domain-containing protein [Myxococcota bacterium]
MTSASTIPADPARIDPSIRAVIMDRLSAIESEHGVRILFACESGSRGWGFASPDSENDVRFIYVHPVEWYLSLSPGPDVIELPVDQVYDIGGWELRKALNLLKKGNPTVVEWLNSPVTYRSEPGFLRGIRSAATAVHRPEKSLHHYLHMAQGNFHKYLCGDRINLKKYLYVLRPLLACMWIRSEYGIPPMRFQDLVDRMVTDSELCQAIDELLARKALISESACGHPIPLLHNFITATLAGLEAMPAQPESLRPDFTILDRLMVDTVLESVLPVTGHAPDE